MTIYIIGHKNPDLDSIISAISYANLKNKLDSNNQYIPARAGATNKETEYILNKFDLEAPILLDNLTGKNIILVDHNESTQIQDGHENANILEILDHHKINFGYPTPISFETKPWGATCSIITKKYCENNIEKKKEMAGALLSAILVDTIITKSPTCTDIDKKIINKLSEIAEIKNWQEFGMDLFKIRGSINHLKDVDIIKSDFKDFNFQGNKFGIGQVETVNLSDFDNRLDGIKAELKILQENNDYHSTILFITDIIKEGSLFLVSSNNNSSIEKAFNTQLKNNQAYISGIMSRKKQVVPILEKIF